MATHSSIFCLENPHGQRSLAGYSPWHYRESDTTEHITYIQEGFRKLTGVDRWHGEQKGFSGTGWCHVMTDCGHQGDRVLSSSKLSEFGPIIFRVRASLFSGFTLVGRHDFLPCCQGLKSSLEIQKLLTETIKLNKPHFHGPVVLFLFLLHKTL